jgi:hypothetical protein
MFAGGGGRGGRVIGTSDRIAAYPKECPLDPTDIHATIYHALGIDPHSEMRDQFNRPVSVSTGRVIGQLF